MNRNTLSVAIFSAILLTACGGGGGNVRNDPPPPTTPVTPPPPPKCEDPNATNNGGALPCTYRYNGEKDNLLVGTSADVAHAAGFTGVGVKIGLLDSEKPTTSYPTVDPRIAFYKDYTSGAPSTVKADHGWQMAAVIVGQPSTGFAGGVAPGASLYWGRVCDGANSCTYSRMGQAFTDMTAQGVRLFNLSIGSYLEDPAQRAQQAANFAFHAQSVLNADGLIVAATGNESRTSPNNPAGTPTYVPEWRNNMLAVTGVSLDSKGNPTGLETYANHCGDAAQWCVASPALFQIPDATGTGIVRTAGTSNATAAVTGVAALVWQAFPWMSASNVQQTVLTTATDLGEVGVDSLYGWGLVNAGKAVKGPGQFVGLFNANVTGTSEFANNITGTGGLAKKGAGTLILGGTNTYTGGTTVEAGTLGLKGNVAGNVDVRANGTLSAMGGRIAGNYSTVDGATTSIQVGKPLEIGGNAALAGTLNLRAEATGYAVQSVETFLRAGTVNGTFGKVTYGNEFFWDVALSYTGTTVTGAMTRRQAAQAAMVASSSSVSLQDGARQADVLVGALDRRFAAGQIDGLEALFSATASLINASDADVAASLPTLTGQVHGVQRSVAVQAAINDSRLAADRLPLLAKTTQKTAWVQADGVDGSLERDGFDGAEYRQNLITVGVDLPLGNAVVGAALTKGRTDADVDGNRGTLDSDRIGVTAFGYLPLGQQSYVAGVIGADRTDVDTRRGVQFGGNGEVIRDQRDEHALHARIEGGLNLDNGLNPFAAVGIVHQVQDAFSEASASGLGLSAGKDSLDVIFADAGVRFDKSLGAWEIGGLLAYRNVFAGNDTDFNAWFTALPEAAFTINGQPVARSSVRALLGAGVKVGASVKLYGNVGVERNDGQGDNATANLGVRWSF